MLQLCCNYFQLNWSLPPNIALGGVGGGGLERHQPPIANFGFKTTGINCALIVLNCADIFSNCNGPFFQFPGGRFSELSPLPHCEIQIRNNENQLCTNCAQLCRNFFKLYRPFFSITRGVVLGIQPPIVNFGFETTGINCAPIALS